MTKEDLLKMELHQIITINDRFTIMRVFGGWIYHHLNNSLFVPEVLNVEAYTTDIRNKTHKH